jgi:hypothetical protein
MSFTNNASKLTGKSITNSFNVVANNITVEQNELVKGNLTVLGNTNIGNVTLENGNVNNLTVNNLTVTTPIPYTSGGTGLSTIGSPNQVLTVNPTGTGLYYQGIALTNPSTVTGTGFTGTPTFNFGIESSGGSDGRGFIRTSSAATSLLLESRAGTGGSITLGPVAALSPAVNIVTAGGIFNLATGAGQMNIGTAEGQVNILSTLGQVNISSNMVPVPAFPNAINISTTVGNIGISAGVGQIIMEVLTGGAITIGTTLGFVNIAGSVLTLTSGAVQGISGIWNFTVGGFAMESLVAISLLAAGSISLNTTLGTIILNGTNTTMNGPTTMNGQTTITSSTAPLVMTISGSAPTTALSCLQASMADGATLPITFGKSGATNLAAVIRFSSNSIVTDNYLGLGFWANDDLYKITAGGVHVWRNTTAETMVLTNTGNLTVTSTTASPLTVNANTNGANFRFFASGATTGGAAIILGKSSTVNESAYLSWEQNNQRLVLGTIGNAYTMAISTGLTTMTGNVFVSQNINWGTLEVNNNTALTVNSPKTILVRGGSGVTITLPNATTLSVGWNYIINNNSNNTVTLVNFTSTSITTILSGQLANVYLITNPNTAGTWDYHLAGSVNSVTATSPLVVTGTVNPVISISSTDPISLGPVTFLQTLSGSVSGEISSVPLSILQSALSAPNSMALRFGKSNTALNSAIIQYNHTATTSTNSIGFGFTGANNLMTLTTTGTTSITSSTTPLAMTISGSAPTTALSCLQASMADGATLPITFGKSGATNLAAVIRFCSNSTLTDNYLGLGFWANDDLYKITAGGVHVWRNTTAETMVLASTGRLSINGTYSSYSSPTLAVNSSTTTSGSIANFFAPVTAGNDVSIQLGVSSSAGGAGIISWVRGSSTTLGALRLGVSGLGVPAIRLQYESVLQPQITIDSGGPCTINTLGGSFITNSSSSSPFTANSTANGALFNFLASGASTGGTVLILGKSTSGNEGTYSSWEQNNQRLLMGVLGNSHVLEIKANSATFNKQLTLSGVTPFISTGTYFYGSPTQFCEFGCSNPASSGDEYLDMAWMYLGRKINEQSVRLSYKNNTAYRQWSFGIGITGNEDLFGIWSTAGGNQCCFGDLDQMPLVPNGIVNISKRGGNGQVMTFYNPTVAVGSIVAGDVFTAYNTSSDYRLKENIVPMENILQKVLLLNPVEYSWKNYNELGYGFIAHEVQEIFPMCVFGEKDAVKENGEAIHQQIDYSKFTPFLTAAIKDLYSLVQTLQTRITTLESQQ